MVEASEQAGLVDEALESGLEGVEMALGLDDDGRGSGDARGHGGGHVLLDGDLALQGVVEREIDDAEAALADQARDLVVPQPRAGTQDVPGRGAGRAREAGARRCGRQVAQRGKGDRGEGDIAPEARAAGGPPPPRAASSSPSGGRLSGKARS